MNCEFDFLFFFIFFARGEKQREKRRKAHSDPCGVILVAKRALLEVSDN